jgi:hypothetical protein
LRVIIVLERTQKPSTESQTTSWKIGTLNEKPLHEALKQWYAQPNDMFEQSIDGFVIDVVHGDLLIEIQTQSFGAIRRKLKKLLSHHQVRLVYPIPCEKWIIKQLPEEGQNSHGSRSCRRKSPKRGTFSDIFNELVSIPQLVLNPNFSLELLLIQEEEVRRYDSNHGWRKRGWITCERRLLKVTEHRTLISPADMASFIPHDLAEPFSTSDLSSAIGKSRSLAQKMAYCLRLMSCIETVGKLGNSILYARIKA